MLVTSIGTKNAQWRMDKVKFKNFILRKGKIMALLTDKVPDSVAGTYYVDDTCIDCDLCRTIAPDHFYPNEEVGYSYVGKQPVTEEEKEICLEAMENCPTDSIGNDGEKEIF